MMGSTLERNQSKEGNNSEGLEVEECCKVLLFFINIQRCSSDKVTFKRRSIGIKREQEV